MRGVVDRYGNKDLKDKYAYSAHRALFDAKALGQICTSHNLCQNFFMFLEDRDGELNWVFHDLVWLDPRLLS